MIDLGRARATAGALAALATSAALPACAGDDRVQPLTSCTKSSTVQAALARAPDAVRVSGMPLSRCLERSTDAAIIQTVGAAYLDVATDLARRASRDPGGSETVRLGYLLGAIRRGAAKTQGIHTELVRRLEQELFEVDTGSPAFRRGERAGLTSG